LFLLFLPKFLIKHRQDKRLIASRQHISIHVSSIFEANDHLCFFNLLYLIYQIHYPVYSFP
jgi:hypothetical protein